MVSVNGLYIWNCHVTMKSQILQHLWKWGQDVLFYFCLTFFRYVLYKLQIMKNNNALRRKQRQENICKQFLNVTVGNGRREAEQSWILALFMKCVICKGQNIIPKQKNVKHNQMSQNILPKSGTLRWWNNQGEASVLGAQHSIIKVAQKNRNSGQISKYLRLASPEKQA